MINLLMIFLIFKLKIYKTTNNLLNIKIYNSYTILDFIINNSTNFIINNTSYNLSNNNNYYYNNDNNYNDIVDNNDNNHYHIVDKVKAYPREKLS